jgi:hypothetical protein
VSYHDGFWVIFVLLQESCHGKHNGAAKCNLAMQLRMKRGFKDVLVAGESNFNMLTCGDDLSRHEL